MAGTDSNTILTDFKKAKLSESKESIVTEGSNFDDAESGYSSSFSLNTDINEPDQRYKVNKVVKAHSLNLHTTKPAVIPHSVSNPCINEQTERKSFPEDNSSDTDTEYVNDDSTDTVEMDEEDCCDSIDKLRVVTSECSSNSPSIVLLSDINTLCAENENFHSKISVRESCHLQSSDTIEEPLKTFDDSKGDSFASVASPENNKLVSSRDESKTNKTNSTHKTEPQQDPEDLSWESLNEEYGKVRKILRRKPPKYLVSTHLEKNYDKIFIDVKYNYEKEAIKDFKSLFPSLFSKNIFKIKGQGTGTFAKGNLTASQSEAGGKLTAIESGLSLYVYENSDQCGSMGTLAVVMEITNTNHYAITVNHVFERLNQHEELTAEKVKSLCESTKKENIETRCNIISKYHNHTANDTQSHTIGNSCYGIFDIANEEDLDKCAIDIAAIPLSKTLLNTAPVKIGIENENGPVTVKVFKGKGEEILNKKLDIKGANCGHIKVLTLPYLECDFFHDGLFIGNDIFPIISETSEANFIEKGDSGALLIDDVTERQEGYAYGLLFFSISDYVLHTDQNQIPRKVGWCTRLDKCLRELNLKWNLGLDEDFISTAAKMINMKEVADLEEKKLESPDNHQKDHREEYVNNNDITCNVTVYSATNEIMFEQELSCHEEESPMKKHSQKKQKNSLDDETLHSENKARKGINQTNNNPGVKQKVDYFNNITDCLKSKTRTHNLKETFQLEVEKIHTKFPNKSYENINNLGNKNKLIPSLKEIVFEPTLLTNGEKIMGNNSSNAVLSEMYFYTENHITHDKAQKEESGSILSLDESDSQECDTPYVRKNVWEAVKLFDTICNTNKTISTVQNYKVIQKVGRSKEFEEKVRIFSGGSETYQMIEDKDSMAMKINQSSNVMDVQKSAQEETEIQSYNSNCTDVILCGRLKEISPEEKSKIENVSMVHGSNTSENVCASLTDTHNETSLTDICNETSISGVNTSKKCFESFHRDQPSKVECDQLLEKPEMGSLEKLSTVSIIFNCSEKIVQDPHTINTFDKVDISKNKPGICNVHVLGIVVLIVSFLIGVVHMYLHI